MRIFLWFLTSVFCLATIISFREPFLSTLSHPVFEYFKDHSAKFAASVSDLDKAISQVDKNNSNTILQARKALKQCRLEYKRIEFFIEYFFKSNAIFYNGPPKPEVEEPYMEWQTPTGLQVIEALLFDDEVYSKSIELKEQSDALLSSAQDIHSLLYGLEVNDQQILESIRLELIRIYTLGITGFDAPSLKSGIEESAAALESIEFSLTPYLSVNSKHGDSVNYYLKTSLRNLQSGKDFDSFDRLTFLRSHGLPLQKYLGQLIKSLKLELNTTGNILNYDALHLFSPDAINLKGFPGTQIDDNSYLIELGKKLFFEKSLSGNNKISCATCHQPEKQFTDGRSKSIAFNGHSSVKRNAPSLLYTAYQHNQFWDGRAKSLEDQIKEVLANPNEMNSDLIKALVKISNDEQYRTLFSRAFAIDSSIIADNVAISIASYLRSLRPYNSPFDLYMQGESNHLSLAQKKGFNLFMGKAQCGTCHFAPLFNGLVPPFYDISELEVLGTPRTDDFKKPEQDKDRGRYSVFPIEFYEQAFKTPTIRNVSATAPYMHNGAFQSLPTVLDFYNKGGGNGIGLSLKNQTLSDTPLKLSDQEMQDIISFLHSLEDSITY